jgi:glycerol-1-phosphate dehydrogenase [NAD(P)+]
MAKPRGSWSGASSGLAKTAARHDLRYGSGLLERESRGWPAYFAVTSPSAFRSARPFLVREPEARGHARLLDWGHLQDIADSVPDGVELIAGMGGGVVVDASKYVALKRGLPLILVPTIVSSGAIVHSFFARWEGHKIIGPFDTWPWLDFDHALIDYELVLEAPYYLNTAGLGDVLCSYSGFCEWRRNSRLGIGEPYDEPALAVTAGHFRQVVSEFPKTLGAEGELTAASVRLIMEAVRNRDDKNIKHPAATAADHPLWLAAEEINGRTWVHGELVALGAVVIAWYCEEDVDTLTGWLDTCMVRWRPRDIDVSREELRRALEYAPAFMSDGSRGNDVNSILRHEPLTGASFDALWAFLQAA